MTQPKLPATLGAPDRGAALLAAVHALVPTMQALAAALDAAEAFPAEDMDALRGADLLSAPLPESLGGLGAGTEPGDARLALGLLRLCGRGNPAVARGTVQRLGG